MKRALWWWGVLLAALLSAGCDDARGPAGATESLAAERSEWEIILVKSHPALDAAAAQLRHDVQRVKKLLQARGIAPETIGLATPTIERPQPPRSDYRLRLVLRFESADFPPLSPTERNQLSNITLRVRRRQFLAPEPTAECFARLCRQALDSEPSLKSARRLEIAPPTLRPGEKPGTCDVALQLQGAR